MAEQQHNMRRLQSGQYLGEISALCFLHFPSHLSSLPYLLAGTGSQLLLYNLETANIIKSFQVFEGIRVHGITCGFIDSLQPQGSSSTGLPFEVAVFGEKRVKLFNLQIEMRLKSKNQIKVCPHLALIHSLPRFSYWVLDVSFLKDKLAASSLEEENHCLAIGCSDNSVRIWDISKSNLILEVQSPERCLLYSMRLWGDNLEDLQIASGTIYNEIIVWKIAPQHGTPLSTSSLDEDDMHCKVWCPNSFQLRKAAHISRLIGHEGSIFRIVWSPDGSKLVSVSDDRSARIWVVEAEQSGSPNGEETAGSVLFGHAARVWDCCMFGSLIMTAGEDCTCRVWGLDGKQLKIIKEHIGRGVWRCLYDPNSSLLITAGFDSAIKVHQLPASFLQNLEGQNEKDQFIDRKEIITSRIPNSSEHSGLMDSKSEYVRCLEFSCEDTLYVATNNGYLYHVGLTQGVKWTKLVQISEKVPIICMDLLSKKLPKHSYSVDDWLALGDGKGKMTIIRVIGSGCTPEIDFTCTWSSEKERQLLGTYWCKALGYRFIFTADPRGALKLWKLQDPLLPVSNSSVRVPLVAEFTSSFGNRIMCLDVSSEDEVLVCGDLRGNLIIFPLAKGLLLSTPSFGGLKVSPLNCFKGAHGISSVSSISISKLSSNDIEICSTGGDGCICHFDYEEDKKSLEFIGMKQVKELSLVQSAPANYSDYGAESSGYAIGFASTDFIIWNLTTDAKVLQIPCGGWRRPHSYYLGDVPEINTCFAYVKDEIIHFHRRLIPQKEMRIFPQNLHIQFHGREVHSLCFVYKNTPIEENVKSGPFDKSRWIATGCEDGTVRLTRYIPGVDSWSSSKLLGEHVGGSAVRSICFVSKMHMISSDTSSLYDWRNEQGRENPFLLISVGAKRVLTSWLLRDRGIDGKAHPLIEQDREDNGNGHMARMGVSQSMSFKWLSTDMPAKNSSSLRKAKNMEKIGGMNENIPSTETEAKSKSPLQEQGEEKLESSLKDEDDWRYLAVTAFLVKCTGSRLTFCFTVVSCSDATLALRALVLPHRLWFDVALLVPLSSPVLALQHVIIPAHLPSGESTWIGNVYLIISGATDGSIAFWNLTDSIESFVRQLSALDTEKLTNCPTRPRTGRGSQGGRWWKSLSNSKDKKKPDDDLAEGEKRTNCLLVDQEMVRPSTNDAENCKTESSQAMHNVDLDSEVNNVETVTQICEIQPLHVFSNVHQSGVNCLHVSDIEHPQNSEYGFFFNVISGGDDQALNCLRFKILPLSTGEDSDIVTTNFIDDSKNMRYQFNQYQTNKCRIRLAYHDKVTSAHSSAIKGVWTDSTWVFTTGLDQRIRCWFLKEHSKLAEYTNLIISVPEPEALHARSCERDRYEIVVAGRGMQMVDFLAS